MPEPVPLILDNAGLKIGDGAATEVLTELACLLNHIEISPDVSITTLTTMCGERDYPGVVKWSLIATLYQSFDPDATEEVLSAALESGVAVGFEVVGLPRRRRLGDEPEVVGDGDPAAVPADQRGRRRRVHDRARVVDRRRAREEHRALMARKPIEVRVKGGTELMVGSTRLVKKIDAAAAGAVPDRRRTRRPGSSAPASPDAPARSPRRSAPRPATGPRCSGWAAATRPSSTRAGSSSAAPAAGRWSSAAATCTRPPWPRQPMAVLAAGYAADNEIRGFSWPRVT